MKSKFMNLFISILLMGLISSCSNSSDDVDPCSSAENVDNPICQKNITTVKNDPVVLELSFVNSIYYNQLERTWVEIDKDNLSSGTLGIGAVPVYSSFLTMSKNAAVNIIEKAFQQKDNPESYQESEYSMIPYIEVKYEKGVDYIYNYIKKDLNGDPVASITGKMIVKNNRVFLPFVNEMFGGQFYSVNDEIGKRFIHQISIVPQSENSQSQVPKRIEFESTLQTPVTDFWVDYSEEMDEFNLDNRFDFYYDGADGVVNEALPFFSLKELDDPEAVPMDIKILFKKRPVIEMEQEIFFENPIDLDRFKSTGEVRIVRGESFYVQKVKLDSNNHFKMKVKMNGQYQNLTDGREFVVNNLPAFAPWNIDFLINFQQSELFNDPQGIPLITPYKPTCNEITKVSFQPLQAKSDIEQAKLSEGFLSLCHPQTNQRLFLRKEAIATTQYDLSDTFYWYFNYIPQDSLKNITGHFNGIRSVKFKLEGCMRVYVKTPTSINWELKSKTTEACKDNDGDEGWVYFNAEKTFTISDRLGRYEGVPGLVNLIQSFGSKPIKRTPHFKFNGLINNVNHIY